jgi:hypothetical protein
MSVFFVNKSLSKRLASVRACGKLQTDETIIGAHQRGGKMSGAFKVLVAVAVVLLVVFIAAGTTGASVEPQIVRVSLTDYQIGVSQFTVVPDKVVTLVINNQGEMAHHLVIQPYVSANEANTITGPVVGAHTSQTFQVTLAPGVYRMECEQIDHANRGMVTAIAAQTPPTITFPVDVNFVVSVLGLVLGCAFILIDSMGFRFTRTPNG